MTDTETTTYYEQYAEASITHDAQEIPAVPHCRAHLEFRSDCERCVSEREFA